LKRVRLSSATVAAEHPGGRCDLGGSSMLDIVFVAVTLAFFLLSWLYVRACERV
jgi:hypothetical protein